MSDKWLICEIGEGQFTGEYAVRGRLSDSSDFSLFAPEATVKFEKAPSGGKFVNGEISVTVLMERGERVLVSLPEATFENGQLITVNKDSVRP